MLQVVVTGFGKPSSVTVPSRFATPLTRMVCGCAGVDRRCAGVGFGLRQRGDKDALHCAAVERVLRSRVRIEVAASFEHAGKLHISVGRDAHAFHLGCVPCCRRVEPPSESRHPP